MMTALVIFAESSYIQKDFFKVWIDWNDARLSGVVDETIPAVVFDPDDPEYGKEDAPYNLTDARNIALAKAKRQLNILLFRGIENLTLDHELQIKDKIAIDEDFREKYNEIFQTNKISYTVKYKKNKVYVGGNFSLTGKDSLIYYLQNDYIGEPFPEFQKIPLPPEYTGLIIDARHLDAKPALFPRVLSDNGLEIYSSKFVDKSAVMARGMAKYLSNPKDSMANESLIGKKPFYIVALNVTGKNRTDLVIPAKEAVKLLSAEKTRNQLKKCKVIILLKP